MMKLSLGLIFLPLLISGCSSFGSVDHGLAPHKNKYGEAVVYVNYANRSNRAETTTASAGHVGQLVGGVLGVTPIVGDLVGRVIASSAGPSGYVPWVEIQVKRAPTGEDGKRFYPAVIGPAYQGSGAIEKNTWVRYIRQKDYESMNYVFSCEIASDCFPVDP